MRAHKYTDIIFGLLPSVAWLLPLLICEPVSLVCALFCAVFIHEGGHLLAFFLTRSGAPRLLGSPVGLVLVPERQLSYPRELIISAAGAFSNLLFAFILLFAGVGETSEGAHLLIGMNIATALYNLLPISTLDGGRIVFSFFAMIFELDTAVALCRAVSYFSIAALVFFSLWLILFFDVGYRMFFSLMLIAATADKNQR